MFEKLLVEGDITTTMTKHLLAKLLQKELQSGVEYAVSITKEGLFLGEAKQKEDVSKRRVREYLRSTGTKVVQNNTKVSPNKSLIVLAKERQDIDFLQFLDERGVEKRGILAEEGVEVERSNADFVVNIERFPSGGGGKWELIGQIYYKREQIYKESFVEQLCIFTNGILERSEKVSDFEKERISLSILSKNKKKVSEIEIEYVKGDIDAIRRAMQKLQFTENKPFIPGDNK